MEPESGRGRKAGGEAPAGRGTGMIYEMLMTGEQNAQTAKDLAQQTGIDRRGISILVERERRAGRPICATCDSKNPGYYIPESREEMQNYCSRLEHREREIALTRQACMKSMDYLPAG